MNYGTISLQDYFNQYWNTIGVEYLDRNLYIIDFIEYKKQIVKDL